MLAAHTVSVPIGALPGGPLEIARLLFHEFLLPFEVTSVLILIAIMGAVVLASRPEAIAHHPAQPEQPDRLPSKQSDAPQLVATGKEH